MNHYSYTVRVSSRTDQMEVDEILRNAVSGIVEDLPDNAGPWAVKLSIHGAVLAEYGEDD